MTKGLSFEQVMSAMKARGVRWPISRALAWRYHEVPKNALEELERRGLVRPGRVPRKHLPPPTHDAELDSFIRDVTELGVRWPTTRDSLRIYGGTGPERLKKLVRHGLIRGPELDDPGLTPTLLRVLEWLEIESKEEFRARMASGELELRRMRNVGKQGVEKLMAWAYGNEAPPPKVGLNLRVSQETKEGLEKLRLHQGLASHAEIVEQLVRAAMRGDRSRGGRER